MKKFIIQFTLLTTLALITIQVILSFADGYSDAYYLKISSPKKSNLILGTSKSAQGLQPKFFKKSLHKEFYNYSFSLSISPYGKTYLNSIKSKLDTSQNNSIFILTVDSWSLSSLTKNPNDSLQFRETTSFLKELNTVHKDPNYNYLINHFDNKYYNLLIKNSVFKLSEDGWLEVFLNPDSTNTKRRTRFTIYSYKKKKTKYNFSSVRLNYLKKTIHFLKKYGEVYIVRLPVDNQLSIIENEIIPDFNSVIKPVIAISNGYLDLTTKNQEYKYTDGIHLSKKSGEDVTNLIANWIKEEQLTKSKHLNLPFH